MEPRKILINIGAEEKEKIREASKIERRSMSNFMVFASLEKAKKLNIKNEEEAIAE